MDEIKKRKYEEIIKILCQLDEQNLLLIDSGARLLLSRQKLEQTNIKLEEDKYKKSRSMQYPKDMPGQISMQNLM